MQSQACQQGLKSSGPIREPLRKGVKRAVLIIGLALATLGVLGGLNLLTVAPAQACDKPHCQ